jgi:uncharacterized membrane protein
LDAEGRGSGTGVIDARRYREAVLWLVRTGKLLLFVAGLVAVLDVVGQRTVSGWAKNAAARRDSAETLRGSLNTVWPHLVAAARLARRPTDRADPDAAIVRERTHAELVASRTPASLMRDVRYTFPVLERHAQELLASRLEPEQAELLTAYLSRFAATGARIGTAIGLMQVMAIPVAVWAFWGNAVAMVVGWFELSGVFFILGGVLLSPRVMLWIRWTGATVSHRLASMIQDMLYDEGRPLRLVALAMFILGSLFDLITGWN